MLRIIVLNKPFKVLSQFTDKSPKKRPRRTLANFIGIKDYRVAGRLDYDSEGLLILTNDGKLQNVITDPSKGIWKTYLVQVEGKISKKAIRDLKMGISLKDGLTRAAKVTSVSDPKLWDRNPPIRFRKSIPDSWIRISIREGRNRQIRRMTSAVGFPTLRLVRIGIGELTLKNLQPGEFQFRSITPSLNIKIQT
mgnify:CR=1 FL=1